METEEKPHHEIFKHMYTNVTFCAI